MPDHSPDDRVAAFTLLAEAAQKMAATAEAESDRAAYLRIARDWFQLANEIGEFTRQSPI